MRARIAQTLRDALDRAHAAGALAEVPADHAINVEKPKHVEHGDFATNLAMSLAPVARMAPRAIAEQICAHIDPENGLIERTEIAGPGFINFRLNPIVLHEVVHQVRKAGETYGRAKKNDGPRVLVEFVSANPTGPLHVGHGRGAVAGDAVASLLEAAGYQVEREYYLNDVGNQMNNLGLSLHARVQTELGIETALPEDGYQGDYLIDVARDFIAANGETFKGVAYADHVDTFIDYAKGSISKVIKSDLDELRIGFDTWFSEKSLHDDGTIEAAVEDLKDRDIIYEKDGALVFRTTDFGDDNDRVVVRSDGRPTYFAADIGYHYNKFDRGFDTAINIWGADHHGYVARVKAALEARQLQPDKLEILMIQFVGLVRDGVQVKMSTRSGQFEELRSIIDEVGADAVRFFFIMRRFESQQEFDLEMAKRRSMDNPVFYVQYGHARLCSILRRAVDADISVPDVPGAEAMAALTLPEERQILLALAEYPYIVRRAAEAREPHQIAFYLMDTIKDFHSYYTQYKSTERVLSDDPLKTEGRLAMVDALRQVISNGLALLKVQAPERMEAPSEEAE
jgi:arginyl-tRNA synthetase